jgi:hypothetical protein
MRKIIKEVQGFTPLEIPVPPMLSKAIGYTGEVRYVSFQWTPYGDEAEYSDGRLSGTGNWQAFLDGYLSLHLASLLPQLCVNFSSATDALKTKDLKDVSPFSRKIK